MIKPDQTARTRIRRSTSEEAERRERAPRRPWYPSDEAKRSFGSLCQQAYDEGEVELLGREDAPLLILVDARSVERAASEIDISIDEAKANWPAVTGAAMLYGSVFRIHGNRIARAILRRHGRNRHPATKYYRRPATDDLAQSIDELRDDLHEVIRRVEALAAALDRRVAKPRGDGKRPASGGRRHD
jgi:hypothetical protein